MPVSGKEETGNISRQSSNCSAGVPIKKRRFPLVRPPSPPPQEPCSIRAENDSIQKECSNTSQGSSLSDASVPTNSPGLSDVNKNSFAKERKEGSTDTNVDSVQSNANLSWVKIEEPNLSMLSTSMDIVDNKEKRLLTEKSACQKISETTELHLALNKELAPNDGEGILFKQNVEKDCKVEPSTVSGNTELSLGLKDPWIPALTGQNRKQSYQLPDKVHPSAFCLSLGKGKPITSKNDENNSNDDTDCLHANRSNWDLNTTMDAWDEGSVGGVVAGQGAVGFEASIGIGSAPDVKPSTISSAGIIGVSGDLGKQTVGGCEQLSNFPISSLCSSEQYKSEDSLHLGLSTPLPSNFSGEKPGTCAKVVSSRTVPDLKFLSVLAPTGNTSSVGCRNVKLEPCIENAKHDLSEVRGDPTKLLDSRPVKLEVVERCSLETLKLSNTSPQKLIEHRPIKSESIQNNQETPRTKDTSYQSDGKVVECDNNLSSVVAMYSNPKKPYSSELPTCSTELSMSVETSNKPKHSDYTMEVNINNEVPHEKCTKVYQVASETVVTPMDYQITGSKLSSDETIGTSGAKDLCVDDSEIRGLAVMKDLALDSRGNGEGSVSDEEKFNISTDMLEEDSFSSDYESDGNRSVVTPRDEQFREDDDDYEDGEVREQPLFAGSDGAVAEKSEAENVNLVDCVIKNVDLCYPGSSIITKSGFNEKEKKLEGLGQSDDHIKECIDAVLKEKTDQGVVKDGSLLESTVEVAAVECDDKGPINTNLLDRSGGKDIQDGHETELSSAGATTSSQGRLTAVAEAADNNAKGIDALENTDSTLAKTEPSLNGNAAAKDANSGQRSRIINLPRATNMSPETRSIPGRSFPSRSGRYFGFDGEKLHPRGNRDETYIDGPHKFRRERFQDHSSRNSRLNIMRGRGRVSNRSLRGDWDSERDFGSESYNGPADYRFSSNKHASTAADGELDCRGYVAPNGPIRGAGRGGRKPLNDELSSFRHPLTRRRSPGGRDGTTTRGVQMVRRFRRNISPNRFIGEDGSDIVGLRRGEKFLRALPDDTMDPVFNRPQPPFDGVDSQFVRGNRNFSSFQRRGLPRIRSKSPIRSRSRSPGPWTSPRRRSPDGFNGLPESTQRRSPAIYRMERMRSPDRPCFPEEMLARRHGSPHYISRPANDLRDMESGRDHGHLRPVMSNRRSPSDEVLPRSTRRFDILDLRERADTDEYFGEAVRSGRFQELGSDGNDDGRRKCSERRGPVRSFRPHYNDADTDNFRFRGGDGPRPFRFRPEADPEFVERSNMREREFDGRIKNRSVNVSRQTRSIEEQEGNYRHGGQVWHDDGFDDSRVKRRRF
ncbi:Serine-rich adhesin for platelets like [Actinidia chinensis var. chinensis]|uniref:Serine-rich adhesin for platelets like n=1 Tax=Actinidia chinensis var. chinensis TaxID=1590841 RepID=A0A2R6RX36_ACTCC|nr:Serine-rich adhesin for platelets like [Actinidia chinensis var. chinensis]